MTELVTLTVIAEGAVRLQIQRRERRNALNRELVSALKRALEEVDASTTRFVVIAGEGPEAFCAGADRSVLGSVDEAGAREFISALHLVLATVRSMKAVTIAAVRGHCIGAGLELAAACDFRVADATARFSMPEVLVGIPSVVEAALLPRLIGWGAASDWMLTGRTVDVAEAKAVGLVQRLVPAGELDAGVNALMDELRPACPRAQAMQKELFRVWEEEPLSEAIQAGIESLQHAYRPIEGVIEAHRRLKR